MNELLVEWVMVICLGAGVPGAGGAACANMQVIPAPSKQECEARRAEWGLAAPDKNYQPAYRGQDIAWCLDTEALNGYVEPEQPTTTARAPETHRREGLKP